MNEITIPIEEYRMLIAEKYQAFTLREFLRGKLECGTPIYTDEINAICKLLGIEAIKNA